MDHNDFNFDDRVYTPIHAVCLDMAKRVFKSSEAYLIDMRSLWTALRWRLNVALVIQYQRQANYVVGRSGHYMKKHFYLCSNHNQSDWTKRGTAWPGPSTVPAVNIFHVSICRVHYKLRVLTEQTFGADPFNTENLTGNILQNLQQFCLGPATISAIDHDRAQTFRYRLESLPYDILHGIFDAMGSLRNLEVVTTSLMPQNMWKDLLKRAPTSPDLLPWLWDLDIDLIEAKDAEASSNGKEWNWELLTRQLSQGVDFGILPDIAPDMNPDADWTESTMTCNGYHDFFSNRVPVGLHNRRRIWQLLEEMFVGDQLPTSDWITSVHSTVGNTMFWTKNGDIRDEPLKLPSFNFEGYLRRVNGEVYIDNNHDDVPEHERSAAVEKVNEIVRHYGYPV